MDAIQTRVDTRSEEYRENFAAMRALVEDARVGARVRPGEVIVEIEPEGG